MAKPIEHKRRIGRKAGVDCAGNQLPEPTVVLVASSRLPAAPDTLGPGGREHWDRMWAVGAGWMSPQTDIAPVTRLCELYDERIAMRAAISTDGLMVEGAAGQMRVNPLLIQVRQLEHEMRLLEVELGFTPAARSRLGYVEVQRVSKLDEMMRRQRGA